MYQDVYWDLFESLLTAMKEYVTYYDRCNSPHELAIIVANKNMIQFSTLAKLDHYKKYMVGIESSKIADANKRNIANVLATRSIRS